MPAAQQRYFAGLIVLQGEERNQKIGCHFVAQAPLRSRVIGLALCAVQLKKSLGHGVQCPCQKELNVGVGHMVAEELSQALAICHWYMAST